MLLGFTSLAPARHAVCLSFHSYLDAASENIRG